MFCLGYDNSSISCNGRSLGATPVQDSNACLYYANIMQAWISRQFDIKTTCISNPESRPKTEITLRFLSIVAGRVKRLARNKSMKESKDEPLASSLFGCQIQNTLYQVIVCTYALWPLNIQTLTQLQGRVMSPYSAVIQYPMLDPSATWQAPCSCPNQDVAFTFPSSTLWLKSLLKMLSVLM